MRSERLSPAGLALALAAVSCLFVGCARQRQLSNIEVTHLDSSGQPHSARQSFEQAFYRQDAGGQWQVALCTEAISQSDPSQTIRQIVLIECIWRPRPGKTLAEKSMTDALIRYGLFNGPHATSYEGAGFVSFRHNARTGELRGRIESGHLTRRRVQGDPVDVFGGQARLTGEFRAMPSAVEVTRLERELNVTLGPPSTR
jgi:hypothetical protein